MDDLPKHTNRLIHETSPYLIQHAHNPVDWFPWSDEAFAKARSDDKPVLVSIGYSACHWCHVMEHESFEDEMTAALMNQNFINIKVDMEERPDVDQIYMNFVQLTTGRGGWPMNVFLTPDKRPFYGGTYFPPSPRYGVPSWRQILTSISDAYRERRAELESSASEIVGELRRLSEVKTVPGNLKFDLLDLAFSSFSRTFDAANGGFGGAPKFPPSMGLEFLMRYYYRKHDERALHIMTVTLDKMAAGGIYDQLGGGFHRYAVDAIWLVPHFEKMLYDNAQLIRAYLHAFQITGNQNYKQTAVETLEYVKREMLDASGGFYSSQDADSEGVEGKYFVWTAEEITQILGPDDGRIFNFYFDVSERGNFEERNILNRNFTIAAAAKALKLDEDTLLDVVERGRRSLFAEREKRIKPHRDQKILTAWNGLMLSAFADAAAILNSKDYLDIAISNANFLLTQLRRDGRLLRTWKDGEAKLNGYLEDYSNAADGLVQLFQASGNATYLTEAAALADLMITEFWDDENGGFFFTSNDHEELVVRNKDFYDNATPSGNSVAADVLLRLAKLMGVEKYERFAVATLRLVSPQLRSHPQGFGRALSAMEFLLGRTQEIVVAGPPANELERLVLERYLPNTVVALSHEIQGKPPKLPLLADRPMVNDKVTAYVCENSVCQRPVNTVDELMGQLGLV